MDGSSGFFTDDSICDCELRQQYLVDDHLQMPRVDNLDVNKEQLILLYSNYILLHESPIFLITYMTSKFLQIRQ